MSIILKRILLILIIFIPSINAAAQKITTHQKLVLQGKSIQLVNSFRELLKKVSDRNISEYEKSLLLKNWGGTWELKLYNNSAVEDEKEYLSINEYLGVLINDYPAGVIFNVELADTSKILIGHVKKDEYRFHATIPIKIKVIGIYKAKQIIKKEHELYMVYSFLKKGRKNLKGFKFVKFTTTNALSPLNRYDYNGLGLLFGSGKSRFSGNQNRAYKVDNKNKGLSQLGLFYYKSINRLMGIRLGLFLKKQSFLFKWRNPVSFIYITQDGAQISQETPANYSIQGSELFSDKDNDLVLPFITSDGFQDLREQNLVILPLSLELKYDNAGIFTPYVFSGIEFRYKYQTNLNASGQFTSQGYYPDYDFILHDLPDYGFFTEAVETSSNLKSNAFSVAPFAGFGLRIHITKKIDLDFNATIAYEPNNKILLEYNSKEAIYKFSPEYTFDRYLMENGLLPNIKDQSNPWVENPVKSNINVSLNLGFFYKF